MVDGSITIATNLDNAKLEKELAKVRDKIKKLEDSLAGGEEKKSPLVKQAEELAVKLKEARAEAARLSEEWRAGNSQAQFEHTAALERVRQLTAEHATTVEQIDKMDKKLLPAYEKLDEMVNSAGELEQQLAEANEQSSRMPEAFKRADGLIEKISHRMFILARRVLIFSVIAKAFRSLQTWLWKATKTSSEATSAVAKLKGALLTLAQPLVGAIIPAFTAFVNVLTKAVTAIASLMALLFGTTVQQASTAAESLNDEADALDATGSAAKKAGKQMAAFDEINQLPSTDEGGAGGGASSTAIAPDFDVDETGALSNLEKILHMAKLIGAALIAWKLSKDLAAGIKNFVGAFLAIDGAIGLVRAAWDAWQNGLDWGNFWSMFYRGAELIGGLWLLFGKLGAGIGLVVTGLTFLVTAFHDAAVNGWNLRNTLMAIAGLILTGLGISLLVGSFIPLLIAGIASALLALTVAMGHGEELIFGLQTIFSGLIDFVKGVFTGDLELAMQGIGKIFEGLKTVVGAVLDSMRDFFLKFFDWLDEKTGGRFHGIIEFAKGIVLGFFDVLKTTANNLISAIQSFFEGLVLFISGVFSADFERALEGVKKIFGGITHGILSIAEGGFNLIIKALNWLISQMNKISFEAPDWVPGIGGKKVGVNIPSITELRIPKLATGAVIPPNREFMAVLGDQKRGTNIEAPMETIKEGVRQVLAENGGGGGTPREITLRLIAGRGFVRHLRLELADEDRRSGVKLVQATT